MLCTPTVDRLLVLIAAGAALALPFALNTAHSAESANGGDSTARNSTSDNREALDTVTVEAQGARAPPADRPFRVQLRRHVPQCSAGALEFADLPAGRGPAERTGGVHAL